MDAVKTGGLIVQARKEKELTQKDLAERLHVSTQAVSKWERGLNCPDIALLEPLAEALGLTVTELLSGQRGEEPKEELVRDSLRFGLDQLGPKIRKWRWLFLGAAVLLLAVLVGLGYVWVRDNTEWLPQRKTTVRNLEPSSREWQIANALGAGGSSLYLYELSLADDFTEIWIEAEVWTGSGLESRQRIMWQGAGNADREIFGPRRQPLVLSMVPHWTEEDGRRTQVWFEYGVDFGCGSSSGSLDPISSPYLSGGMCTSVAYEPTVYWPTIRQVPAVADPEEGLVLMRISLGGPDGSTYAPSSELREETVNVEVRLYCK